MEKLSIMGGAPVRNKPFMSSVVIDEQEYKEIDDVLKSLEFSRFIGSPSEDIEKVLLMSSKEACEYQKNYFSFLGGKKVREFEKNFAEIFQSDYAISVNSATSGLSTALGAAGIGPGDEVITTCLSFNATAISILMFNSIPVFVDVSLDNYCMDPEKVEQAITPNTKAILVVHLLGFAANMSAIMDIAKRNNLVVIEDCAQAPGTLCENKPVGTIGDIGVFSFQETKNMMTGEGGMIITNNQKYARSCRLIRNHGESIPDDTWKDNELENIIGMNFRMTELTAALGISQLKKLKNNNKQRLRNTLYLQNELRDIKGLKFTPFPEGSIPHILPIIFDQEFIGVPRNTILKAIQAEGIPVGGGYVKLIPQNPIFQKKIGYGINQCPWVCNHYSGNVNYNLNQFPVARKLIGQQFIWFYNINAPNTIADMDDVVTSFHKVFCNLELLKTNKIEPKNLQYKW